MADCPDLWCGVCRSENLTAPVATRSFTATIGGPIGQFGGSPTITVSGLSIATQYQIQFWASATGQALNETISGSSALNTDTGSNGQFVVGTFTADALSQVLTATGTSGGENFIVANALTIGTIPEPSAALLGGLDLLGLLRRSGC
jgi:hypothetical protein